MTHRQYAIFMASLYFVMVFFFVTTAPLAVAIGTGGCYMMALAVAELSDKTRDLSIMELQMFLRGWL